MISLEKEDIEFLMNVLFELEQRRRDHEIPEPIQRLVDAMKDAAPDEDVKRLEELLKKKQQELKYQGVQAFRVRVKLDEILKDMEIAELAGKK